MSAASVLCLLCALSVGLASGGASVSFTAFPTYGATSAIRGTVTGLSSPTSYKVALYVYTDSWYTKPDTDSPTVPVLSNGSFTFASWATSPTYDSVASIIAVYVIPSTATAPTAGANDDDWVLPTSLDAIAVAHLWKGRGTLEWSGYDLWQPKSGSGGPGPNNWSNSSSSLWVDADGLHMTVRNVSSTWYSTEVTLLKPLGLGTYAWQTTGNMNALDKCSVLGLFTWDDHGAAASYREIDYEFSRWADDADSTNAQFVVQPFETKGHLMRWTAPQSGDTNLTIIFRWESSVIRFWALRGHQAVVAGDNPVLGLSAAIISNWTFDNKTAVFGPGTACVHINLWSYCQDGCSCSPSNGENAERIIKQFTFFSLNDTADDSSSASTAATADAVSSEASTTSAHSSTEQEVLPSSSGKSGVHGLSVTNSPMLSGLLLLLLTSM